MKNWCKYFSVIASSHECQYNKPDPGVFVLAANRLNNKTSECLAVENDLPGVIAAKRAGMYCWAVVDEKNFKHSEKIKQKADLVTTSLEGSL